MERLTGSNKIYWIHLLLLTSLLGACVVNPTATTPDATNLKLPDFEDLLPDGPTTINAPVANPLDTPQTGKFAATLTSLGVRLSTTELNTLKRLIQIKPTGKWSRTRTQNAAQTLSANFKRFGSLFQPPPNNEEDYQQRAVSFAEKENIPYFLDLQYYLDSNQFLVIRWDSKTGEFVGIQPDGTLINYLVSFAVKSPRYVEIDL
ncbi:hypothetical protein COW36_03595 [bacterium (Candidatus Blackallbacteria) CG17_big_fil_post_rev_8_21_14_2_50_48_46]|uniref:Lipoprotein n=1 Tax=bacterium (Candidatus Blackallbacteria) CG17_big_fil_post_rev_8_21_14_2_50_48_46 TaxID=2014261 RepID=A0A2M7G8F7_9BACT|nr:MAG: hypothetical protein COW64_20765 [bacterium (Candidatus Blackallbacteria) CG18_big_fil_WC_8_21_14_2_50_49_26]PIW18388.1 MAG: hypothetical protein COW36_03595 [bacterium (Candidatus Blackallbacteria) CG17_big_fil_post_rev_8_21_14_2_50_48_46]PIW50547.1 MAG: hypothetical protein COW20_02020 [bacterium (Candidatus Blackallbacteria) CG13_big_fil_rev_8_21_14_2_50_49_14]